MISALSKGSGLLGGGIGALPPVARLGIVGEDLQRMRVRLAVAEGDHVRTGDLLLSDRKRPWIRMMAALGRVVSRLEPGPRRGIAVLEINPDLVAPARRFDPGTTATAEELIDLMVGAGMRSALRTRPFGGSPTRRICLTRCSSH